MGGWAVYEVWLSILVLLLTKRMNLLSKPAGTFLDQLSWLYKSSCCGVH